MREIGRVNAVSGGLKKFIERVEVLVLYWLTGRAQVVNEKKETAFKEEEGEGHMRDDMKELVEQS